IIMQDIDIFVYQIALAKKEQDEHQKLLNLQLTDEEWLHVIMLLRLLTKAEYMQQSFSSDCGPTTHLTLPALEALHKAW
ncbi:hypothetical protein J3R82DRAFT_3844, partial [Butyriboletus roseoflavus]